MSSHTIPYHTIPYHTTPHHTIPYHTIPYHMPTMPGQPIPYHTVPSSCHVMSCHAMPCCIMPRHNIPYRDRPIHRRHRRRCDRTPQAGRPPHIPRQMQKGEHCHRATWAPNQKLEAAPAGPRIYSAKAQNPVAMKARNTVLLGVCCVRIVALFIHPRMRCHWLLCWSHHFLRFVKKHYPVGSCA